MRRSSSTTRIRTAGIWTWPGSSGWLSYRRDGAWRPGRRISWRTWRTVPLRASWSGMARCTQPERARRRRRSRGPAAGSGFRPLLIRTLERVVTGVAQASRSRNVFSNQGFNVDRARVGGAFPARQPPVAGVGRFVWASRVN